MSRALDSPGARLRSLWSRLAPLPGGRWLFSRLLGRLVPYTGTLGATVVELTPGHARVQLADRRRVRNHLRCVHAIALTNLGEMTSGLALLGAMPPSVRGILVAIETQYAKKARGRLEARCRCVVPTVSTAVEQLVETAICDASGDIVARVRARWLLSPVPSDASPA
jgi:acyl-coenzyme A thioesterase PaaI-like protein